VARTVRVKICGLTGSDDALQADEAGADYLGVVMSEGFVRCVTPSEAAAVVSGTRTAIVAVLVDERPDGAAERARAIGASVLQLHGTEPPDVVTELRRRGDWALWKAVRARSLEDVEAAVERYGHLVDGILVEGWRAGVVGGGGARLRLPPDRVRAAIPPELTFILAGGLDPDNVAEAVAHFLPDIVDVSSGTEREPRRKDPARVRAFLTAVREASRALADRDDERRPEKRIG
jgi:phosphoribosylanthranilate isomerase